MLSNIGLNKEQAINLKERIQNLSDVIKDEVVHILMLEKETLRHAINTITIENPSQNSFLMFWSFKLISPFSELSQCRRIAYKGVLPGEKIKSFVNNGAPFHRPPIKVLL